MVLVFYRLHDKNFLPQKNAIQLQSSFHDLLMALVQQQNGRVIQQVYGNTDAKNYLECIRTFYKEGQLSVASSVECFNAERHDGVIHRNRLYLRGDKLNAFFPKFSISEIVDTLDAQGALEIGNGSRTKQIGALNGMRFYVIPLECLS